MDSLCTHTLTVCGVLCLRVCVALLSDSLKRASHGSGLAEEGTS